MTEITTHAESFRALALGGYIINQPGYGAYYLMSHTKELNRLSDVVFLRLVRREEISRDPETPDIWRMTDHFTRAGTMLTRGVR